MKNMGIFLIISALLFTFAGSDLLAQKGPGPQGGPGMHQRMDGPGPDENGDGMMILERDLLKQVGLSKEQESKIDALVAENQKANIARQSEMKILGIDLRTEMEKEKIDMAKVTELADKIGKLRAEQAKSRILHAAQVASVMTKEQRDQLEKLRAERRQQMMERFHQNPGKPMKPRK